MISRDVSRLGERLDMARLLSFYYSGPGFYLNVALTVTAASDTPHTISPLFDFLSPASCSVLPPPSLPSPRL